MWLSSVARGKEVAEGEIPVDAIEFFVLLVKQALCCGHAVKGALTATLFFLALAALFFLAVVVFFELGLKFLAVGGIGAVAVVVDEEYNGDEKDDEEEE